MKKINHIVLVTTPKMRVQKSQNCTLLAIKKLSLTKVLRLI